MDDVDQIVEQWRAVAPGLDTAPVPTVGRILRIAAKVSHRNDAALVESGLTRGEFDLLCALRRADRGLRASQVSTISGVSGAAITKWADSLARAGLIVRTVPERDRRGVLLTLTETGRAAVDERLPGHLAREEEAVAHLTTEERAMLALLLTKVLAAVDR